MYGDVLEHLSDPLAALVALNRALAADGLVIASVPNVAHLWVRLQLLAGRFEYADRGILDRTHLRFFTRRTFVALLAQAGLAVEELAVTPVPLPLVVPDRLHGAWLYGLHAASAAASRGWKSGLAYQFVAMCRPRAAGRSPAARVGGRRDQARAMTPPKIVVVMPAYNAGRTLRMTYEELPKDTVNLVILVDDGSTDATLEIARELGLEIFVHDRNYGYGANQKTCYTEALRAGCDVVVMVHPDYQYDPTLVPKIIEPILKGQADLVLGSRLKGGGSAIQQGMPWWKYVSNRFLTGVENLAFGLHLSEFHTGYRAFSREALEAVNFRMNSDGFVFDQEIISQAVAAQPSHRRDRGARPLFLGGLIRELLGLVPVRAQDSLGGGPVSASPDGDQAVAAAHGPARPVSPPGPPGVARRALIAVRRLPGCGRTRRMLFSILRGGRWASGGGVLGRGEGCAGMWRRSGGRRARGGDSR